MSHCEFILGGARSGKSALAQRRASTFEHSALDEQDDATVTYIATATAGDGEMADRIQHHRDHRPARWHLVEEPLALAQAIAEVDSAHAVILVDCLTLWVTNLLCSNNPERLEKEKNALLAYLPKLKGKVIFVSNETGLGIIPMDPLSRQFIDEAGWLHQRIAEQAHTVIYCIAGLEHVLKSPQ